jgi:hypothetical protein
MMTHRVSDSIRNRNRVAVNKRNNWRARYNYLAQAIWHQKHVVRGNASDAGAKLELRALQMMAQAMCDERKTIGEELRTTAYEWV